MTEAELAARAVAAEYRDLTAMDWAQLPQGLQQRLEALAEALGVPDLRALAQRLKAEYGYLPGLQAVGALDGGLVAYVRDDTTARELPECFETVPVTVRVVGVVESAGWSGVEAGGRC